VKVTREGDEGYSKDGKGVRGREQKRGSGKEGEEREKKGEGRRGREGKTVKGGDKARQA
jgi:hypothetical protein